MAEASYDEIYHCIKPELDIHDIAVDADHFLDIESRIILEFITPRIARDALEIEALKRALGIQHGELTYQYETMEDDTVQRKYIPPDPDWYCGEYHRQLYSLKKTQFTATLRSIISMRLD